MIPPTDEQVVKFYDILFNRIFSESFQSQIDRTIRRRAVIRRLFKYRLLQHYFDYIYKIYYSLAWVEINVENSQAALNWLEEMEQTCLAHDNEVRLARCYHGLGDLCAYYQNNLQQASQWFEKTLAIVSAPERLIGSWRGIWNWKTS